MSMSKCQNVNGMGIEKYSIDFKTIITEMCNKYLSEQTIFILNGVRRNSLNYLGKYLILQN